MKIRETDFECWNEDELVCPYCHDIFSDSWEYIGDGKGNEQEAECGNCGKSFIYYAENSGYKFSSYKLEEEDK